MLTTGSSRSPQPFITVPDLKRPPDRLERSLGSGRNDCESSPRPLVIGRLNCLFADIEAGANTSVYLYSLLETRLRLSMGRGLLTAYTSLALMHI